MTFVRAALRSADVCLRGALAACLVAGPWVTASAEINGLNTSGQTTYTDGQGYTRDSNWAVVGVPDLSGNPAQPWSPPNGQSVPYAAYVFSTIPGAWVGAGPGGTNAGVAVPDGKAFWIGADTSYTAPTGVGGTQRDTAYRTTFVNTGSTGNYRLKFTATGDNFISIFANGTLTTAGTNQFTVSGGNQIGTTTGNFSAMVDYDSVVPLLSGTNQLYVIIGDLGGATGMVFGGFAEPTVLTPYWAPSTGAGGTQTWNTTDTFWAPNADGSGTKDNWNNAVTYNSEAYFGGTPGTVTASGTLNVYRVNLTTSGYTITGGATDRLNFFGVSGSTPAIRLSSGVSGTVAANLSGGSGNFYSLDITSGSGSQGTLVYAGNSTMSGAYGMTYNVTNARLVLNGTFAANNSSINLASTASLAGSGRTTGAILGAGSVNPGGSGTASGILTVGQVAPSGGLDFTFVYSGTNPTFGSAADSVNDLMRITGGTPFSTGLTSANTKTLFLNMTEAQLGLGTILKGGFFTDGSADFLSMLNNQTWDNGGFQVYVLGDGLGTDNRLNGQGYYNWRNPAMFGWTQSLFLSTEAQTADFGSGNVNGRIMTLVVGVPEPSTYVMALAGLACGGFSMWRRRKRA